MTDTTVDPLWRENAWRGLELLAESGELFVAYDLVRLHGVGEPGHHSQWGALLSTARKVGLIVPISAGPSPRRTVAGSLVRIWRGAPSVRRREAA